MDFVIIKFCLFRQFLYNSPDRIDCWVGILAWAARLGLIIGSDTWLGYWATQLRYSATQHWAGILGSEQEKSSGRPYLTKKPHSLLHYGPNHQICNLVVHVTYVCSPSPAKISYYQSGLAISPVDWISTILLMQKVPRCVLWGRSLLCSGVEHSGPSPPG